MATFYNQATLSYGGKVTNSNVTTGEILEVVDMSKISISANYGADDSVAYALSIVNNGNSAISDLTVTDDLGAYTVGANTVYPLEYVAGSLKYYVNGIEATTPAVTAGPPLTISGISIPSGSNAMLVYEAKTNEYANLAIGSSITNTATAVFGNDTLTSTATVSVGEETTLTISKSICPATVNDNGELTYTFVIQNSGNTPATVDSGVIISDTFNPILNPISVTFNGEAWTENVNYTYSTTTGEFVTADGSVTVPAATYTQDAETGVITLTPGVSVLTVTGTV